MTLINLCLLVLLDGRCWQVQLVTGGQSDAAITQASVITESLAKEWCTRHPRALAEVRTVDVEEHRPIIPPPTQTLYIDFLVRFVFQVSIICGSVLELWIS